MRLICIYLLAISSLLLNGCNLKEKKAEAEKELKALKAENKDLRSSHNEQRREVVNQKRVIGRSYKDKEELEELEEELQPLADYHSQLSSAIDHYDAELERWRSTHRKSLVGLRVPYIEKADGSRIEKAEIIEVSDETIKVLTFGETKEYQISELSEGAQRKIVYETNIK